ncbi:MAG: hypothetical protein KIT17_12360 [Rubrivivax sp.]|nr:hypothetical protein [Rubrivivax sp.]
MTMPTTRASFLPAPVAAGPVARRAALAAGRPREPLPHPPLAPEPAIVGA